MTRLPSGKEIKVLGVGTIYIGANDKALMLKYQTDLKIDDMSALQPEVDEIWNSFRADVENQHMSIGIISANETPTGSFVSTNRGFNFVFKKTSDGTWSQQR